MAGNLEVTDLPVIPAVNGADVYGAKNNLDYRIRTGEAGGLATLDGSGKLQTAQAPVMTTPEIVDYVQIKNTAAPVGTYTRWSHDSTGQLSNWTLVNSAASALTYNFDFTGSAASVNSVRFFRSTNSSASPQFVVYNGDNTTTTLLTLSRTSLNVTPSITTAGTTTVNGGTVNVNATAGNNAHYFLRDETSTNQGLLFWDRASDSVILRRYNAAGSSAENQMTMSSTGTNFSTTIQSAGSVVSALNFNSSGATVVLATTGAGDILLRPNGVGSSTGQVSINSSGNYVGAGSVRSGAEVTAAQNFNTTSTNVILSNNGTAGTIFLRPNGVGSAVGQTTIDSAGNTVSAGTLATGSVTVTGSLSTTTTITAGTGFQSTNNVYGGNGSVLLRPLGIANATNQVTIDGSGSLTTVGHVTATGQVSSAQNFTSNSANIVMSTTGAGTVYFRPNGAGSTTGEVTVNSSGTVTIPSSNGGIDLISGGQGTQYLWNRAVAGQGRTEFINNRGGGAGGYTWWDRANTGVALTSALMTLEADGDLFITGVGTGVNWIATSDKNLKHQIKTKEPRQRLPDLLRFVEFLWKADDKADIGVIAQEVREVAPEYVYENADGVLAVDKASLALECVIGLAARVRELEEKI